MNASKHSVWVYWENPSGQSETPAHIRLCLRTIRLAAGAREVHVVDESTARQVAPSLPQWWDHLETLAHKADVLKAHLLYHCGGLVMDADTIAVRDLEFVFTLLEQGAEFLGFGPTGDPSIGVLAARRGSMIANQWLQNQLTTYASKEETWEAYGNGSLSPVTRERPFICLPWNMTHPFPWYEWKRYLTDESAEQFGDGAHAMFSLFNKGLGPQIVQHSEDLLLGGTSLLSQLFRIALDEEERRKFCWRAVREFCDLDCLLENA